MRRVLPKAPMIVSFLLALLLASVTLILAGSARLRLHPLLLLLAGTFGFAMAAGMSFNYTAQLMGQGFAATIEGLGLVVIAAAIVGALNERGTTGQRPIAAGPDAGPDGGRGPRLPAIMSAIGFAAGVAPSVGAAFAFLAPLNRALAVRWRGSPAAGAVALALGLLATHSVLPPAPGPVAAAAILGAGFGLTALFGLLLALVAGGAGWLSVVALARGMPATAHALTEPPVPQSEIQVARRPRTATWRAWLPILVPVLLLMLSAVSQMPNDPLGGGANREFITGLARPVMLLVIGCGLALVLLPPPLASLTEKGSIGAAIGEAAGVVLIVGAAGAFAKILQNSGLPEAAAGALAGLPAGILVPFLIAAILKTVQGSSLVAVIMAAGFTQPLLGDLGLDGEAARALAAVAIGAGSLVICHVNDSYFWLVARIANLTPLEASRLISVGTLVQGVSALAVLLLLSAIFT